MKDITPTDDAFAEATKPPDAVLRSPHAPEEVKRRLNHLFAKGRLSLFNLYRGKIRKNSFKMSPVVPMQQSFNYERLHGTFIANEQGTLIRGRFRLNWLIVAFPIFIFILFMSVMFGPTHPGNEPPIGFYATFIFVLGTFLLVMTLWQRKWSRAQRRNIIRDLADYLDAEIDVLPPSQLKLPPSVNGNAWPNS